MLFLILTTVFYCERKSSAEMFACFNIALKVPSGISPEWLGIVVYKFVALLSQISWLPLAWR